MRGCFSRLRAAVATISFVALFLSLLGYIINAAFQGIIGNEADTLFLPLWSTIKSDWNIVVLLIALLIFVILCALIIIYSIFHFNHRTKSLKDEHASQIHALEMRCQTLSDLLTLEDTLIRLLPSLPLAATATEKEEAMRRLIEKLLVDAIKILSDHVSGASLYLPDQNNEHLKIWESHGVSREVLPNAQCYIGPARPGVARGVAGEAFIKREIIIAHQTGERNQDGGWKFDRESFIDFDGSHVPPHFSSLACIPLIDHPGSRESRGVICFDSRQRDTFDSPEMQERLRLIERCFTSALLIYQEITHNQLLP